MLAPLLIHVSYAGEVAVVLWLLLAAMVADILHDAALSLHLTATRRRGAEVITVWPSAFFLLMGRNREMRGVWSVQHHTKAPPFSRSRGSTRPV